MMEFRFDPLVLKKTKAAAIAYAVGIAISVGLFLIPLLFGQKLEWTYPHLIFGIVLVFLAYQLVCAVRLNRIVRRASVTLDPETVSGSDHCGAMKRPIPFSVRYDSIRSVQTVEKDLPSIGKVKAIRIVCDDGDRTIVGIERSDELLLELQKRTA